MELSKEVVEKKMKRIIYKLTRDLKIQGLSYQEDGSIEFHYNGYQVNFKIKVIKGFV